MIHSPPCPPVGGCANAKGPGAGGRAWRTSCSIYPGIHPILFCVDPKEARALRAFAHLVPIWRVVGQRVKSRTELPRPSGGKGPLLSRVVCRERMGKRASGKNPRTGRLRARGSEGSSGSCAVRLGSRPRSAEQWSVQPRPAAAGARRYSAAQRPQKLLGLVLAHPAPRRRPEAQLPNADAAAAPNLIAPSGLGRLFPAPGLPSNAPPPTGSDPPSWPNAGETPRP